MTLVNPVRGRNLWLDKTLKPITDQYSVSAKYNFPTTWLLQYDALVDEELVTAVKSFEIGGEKGVLLEVSANLADESGVVYNSELKWSNPAVIFLSAYSQGERRLLIDTLFHQFKKDFGYYPKSVGAWWIDSYSINYIKEKYGLKIVMIVADQKTTDSYGVWGQWWGYPYYPSKYNVLIPVVGGLMDTVVIQWAQRDPILAYGEGSRYSNFSLQANDYIRSGKNTDYFKDLTGVYLDCQNPIGQITVGLETGMESIAFHGEYVKQLEVVSEYKKIEAVTMSDFAGKFRSVYKENPKNITIGSWNLTPIQRENKILGDSIVYNQNISFSDYFLADKSNFLDRRLASDGTKSQTNSFPWFLSVFFALAILAFKKRKMIVWICSSLFTLAAFGLLLRSTVLHGWQVFYSPVIGQVILTQCLVVLATYTFFSIVLFCPRIKFKNIHLLIWLLPLSFGLDRIVSVFRYSVIDGKHLLGIAVDRLRIIGLMLGGGGIELSNRNYSITQSLSFQRLPMDHVWQNIPVYLVAYPLIHFLVAITLYILLIRAPKWVNITILAFLIVLYVMQVIWIFRADPVSVVAITN